jgi:DNA-binding LytR/AlgR family response regulator
MYRIALIDLCTQITYLSGEQNYTRVHFMQGKDLLLSRTLSACADELPTFIRIHKKYLVNPQCIRQVLTADPKKASLLLDTVELPISRRRVKEVLEKVWLFSVG